MASPVAVELPCPLCGAVFRARTMGASYYISGTDTDLRETGSIEEVRRYSVATCSSCRYSDYTWNFETPDVLSRDEQRALRETLGLPEAGERPHSLGVAVNDFERFRLAERCLDARGAEQSSLAELALHAYYVARDLGRRDLEPSLRDEAAGLFAKALEEERDMPAPLRLRYAYLAGELNRRAGRSDEALAHFDAAIQASREAEDDDGGPDGAAWDIGSLARRMQTRALHRDAPARDLVKLIEDHDDPDAAAEARRLLASRRDRASVEAVRGVWRNTPPRERTALLEELVDDPPAALFDLFVEALESPAPTDVRLAARALGALGEARAQEPLLRCLDRGVLSTEAALIEALRRIDEPGTVEAVAEVLARWERENPPTTDPEELAWRFTNDTTPLENYVYTEGGAHGLELLIGDMRALEENDLWDKVPSGGPVSAALAHEAERVELALRGLLSAERPATRRWAAFCLAEHRCPEAAADIAPLVGDPDQVVRLQAATALARLGDPSHEDVVLSELRALAADDVPFALHFLVPFRSAAVKRYLLELLEGDVMTRGEVLPLLGRQEPDDALQEILNTALLDTSDDTRAGAVTGLAYQGGAEVPARLRLLYDQEESDEVRRRIVFGIGQLARAGHDREETVAFLRRRINRGNPRLRFSIALTLLHLGDPTGVDLVRERAALFDESFDRYDLVAPALKALSAYDQGRTEAVPT